LYATALRRRSSVLDVVISLLATTVKCEGQVARQFLNVWILEEKLFKWITEKYGRQGPFGVVFAPKQPIRIPRCNALVLELIAPGRYRFPALSTCC
jgi:hypothetical protein